MTPYYESERAILYLGDCRDVIPKHKDEIDVIVSDPPYGIAWARNENKSKHSKGHKGIANDGDTTVRDDVLRMLPDVPALMFGSFYAPFPDDVKHVLVWHKPADAGVVGAKQGWRRDAEPIFVVGPWPVRPVKWSSVFHVRRGQSFTCTETGHPHTKPIELMVSLLYCCPDGTVLDPFMGSGSTGVACMKTGHRFIGVEIDEEYCEIARRRICAMESQQTLDLEVA